MIYLLLNTLSRFVIAFLPRSKHLLILCLQSACTVIFKPKTIKSVTVSTFSPSICHEVMGTDAIIDTYSLSSFTLIKRLFNSSSLSAIKFVSSAYLRLLILLPTILIPAFDSSSPAFLCYTLHKQGDHVQPCHIPFPILNQSAAPCLVLTVAS